jgi:hypothetical protein
MKAPQNDGFPSLSAKPRLQAYIVPALFYLATAGHDFNVVGSSSENIVTSR